MGRRTPAAVPTPTSTTSTATSDTLTPGDAADALAAAGFTFDAPVEQGRTVLDTFDGRLHGAGLQLVREALDATSGRATLLLTGRDTPPAHLDTERRPGWPSELPPGPFRSRIAAVTKERVLLPVLTYRSTVRRARRVDSRGKATVVVDVHQDVTAGEPSVGAGWFAEVLPVLGHDGPRENTLDRLRSAGLDVLAGDGSALVAARVGAQLAGFSSSPSVPLDAAEPALDAYRRVLGNLAATVVANLPGTIDDLDSEFLHELRVAVRRSRSILAQAKGVVPDDVRARFREEFAWLGDVTTDPRDLDVYLLGWSDYVSPLPAADADRLEPVRAELDHRRTVAHDVLSEALASERARELLVEWTAWLAHAEVEPLDGRRAGPLVAKRIEKLQRQLVTDGRAITTESPADHLHDLRKDAKKLRYMIECFGTMFDPKARKAFVGQLKALQDNLGEHQDAEVHLAQLGELADDLQQGGTVDASVLLAMGRLSEHLDRRRLAEREAFAKRFAAYDTKANRALMKQLLAPARPGKRA
jgi:CHAD domain-containing protein